MILYSDMYDKIVELAQANKSNKEICTILDIHINFLLSAKRKIRSNGVILPLLHSEGRPKENKQFPSPEQSAVIIDLSMKGYHIRQIAHELSEKETRVYKWKQYIAQSQHITFPRATIRPYFSTIAEHDNSPILLYSSTAPFPYPQFIIIRLTPHLAYDKLFI